MMKEMDNIEGVVEEVVQKQYKTSFDRFGDDLSEEILQYLSFEDKLRLECVAKQWRRVVFSKQYVVHIADEFDFHRSKKPTRSQLHNQLKNLVKIGPEIYNSCDKSIDLPLLESVLKKCPNITEVFDWSFTDGSELSLIGKYCSRLKTLKFCPHYQKLDKVMEFARRFGHKLTKLESGPWLYQSDIVIWQFLDFCPNLQSLCLLESDIYLSQYKDMLMKIDDLKVKVNAEEVIDHLKPGEPYGVSVQDFIFLSTKYSTTLKRLQVRADWLMSINQLNRILTAISRFQKLEVLEVIIECPYDETIDAILKEIGRKCTKIKRLIISVDIKFSNYDVITYQDCPLLWPYFRYFKNIEILDYSEYERKRMTGSVECLSDCRQLKHLIIHSLDLSDEFFVGTQTVLPNLRSIEFNSYGGLRREMWYSLSSMKSLQTVKIIRWAHLRIDVFYNKSYANCDKSQLKEDHGHFGVKLTSLVDHNKWSYD